DQWLRLLAIVVLERHDHVCRVQVIHNHHRYIEAGRGGTQPVLADAIGEDTHRLARGRCFGPLRAWLCHQFADRAPVGVCQIVAPTFTIPHERATLSIAARFAATRVAKGATVPIAAHLTAVA